MVPNALLLGSMWGRLQHEFAPSPVRTCTEVPHQRVPDVRVELESGVRPVLFGGSCVPAGALVEKRRWEYGHRVDGSDPFPPRWPHFTLWNLAAFLVLGLAVLARLRRKEGASEAAPAGPLIPTSGRARVHPLPHRVRLYRGVVLMMGGLLTALAIGVGYMVVRFETLTMGNRLILVLVFFFTVGMTALPALGQTYTLTPDALVRFLPVRGRTLRYADLVHVEVSRVRGHPLLTLQRRQGRPVELFVAMVDPGELLFTLNTLAERAPAAVFGPEALRLREQARRAEL